MTIREAAEKWGVSISFVRARVVDGRIPSVLAARSEGMHSGGPLYIIPDDTPLPEDYGKGKGFAFNNRYHPAMYQADFLSDDERLAYVWAHQNQSISSIAKHLWLPSRMIPRLYDQAFARFQKEGEHAPQP